MSADINRIHGGDWEKTSAGALDFSVNVNPLGMPLSVAEAAQRAVTFCNRYPDPACRELRQELGAYYHLPDEWILCGNGAADLIFRLVQALKPKKAALFAPTFSEYEIALNSVGCEIRTIPLPRENDFLLEEIPDLSWIEEGDLLFLCNPNNPTGQAVAKSWLEEITKRCAKAGAFLCVDECFLEFWECGEQNTMLSLLGEYKNVLVLRAFTKAYAMAGLRLGWCSCADKDLLREMELSGAAWNVSIPAQAAGLAALREAGFLTRTRLFLQKERPRLKASLESLGLTVSPSQANYLCFRAGSPDLKEKLLKRGILVRNCGDYRGLDAYDYRVAIKTPEENQRLIQALKACIYGG